MGFMRNLFKKEPVVSDNRPILVKLVDYVKTDSVNKAIPFLTSNGKSNNPRSIPYTAQAISNDFSAVRICMQENNLDDNELAALICTKLLMKHPTVIHNLMIECGYETPDINRIIYLCTYTTTVCSLREFASLGIKNYRVSGCGDQRMCAKCAKQNNKKHLVSKAVIGKTASPFCEKCRCVITAEL